jgi:imidazolonepropionase-like amidohydrolase
VFQTRLNRILLFVLICGLITGGILFGGDGSLVIKADKIYTGTGAVIQQGMIIVRDGKIFEVGTGLSIPENSEMLRAKVVIPGLVDIHSHVGVYTLPLVPGNMDGNETTNPITPEVRAYDSFNFGDLHVRDGLAGGVTTIVARPGSANVIGGTSMAVKLKDAPPEQMVLKKVCDLKMTIEYNPVRFYGQKNRMPSSLMSVYFLARKAFIEAQDYKKSWEKYEREKKEGKTALRPKKDLGKEALVMALNREIPVHVHVCTASEIMSAIRLADEFNLKLSLAHVPCAYQIVEELAVRKDVHFNVGCTPLYTYYGDGLKLKNVAAILANAGLPVSLQADTVGEWQSNLLYFAAMCVRYGMKEDDALKAITIRGAEGISLDDRIGSIEPGKDADLALLNGEPFEMTTSVEKVLIEGRMEYRNQNENIQEFHTPIADAKERLSIPSSLSGTQPFAVRAGTIFSMAAPPLKNGVILIKDGKIEKIGSEIPIPENWPVVDAEDFTIMPGLVNPRSYVGIGLNWRRVVSTDETSKPAFPELEVKHAIDPFEPDFTFARQLGVTTALVTPGNKNVIGGQGTIIRTTGSIVHQMVLKENSVLIVGLGNPAKRPDQMPATRMGIASLLREEFTRAAEYLEKRKRQKEQPRENITSTEQHLEVLAQALEGKKPVMIHCDRQDDIMAAMRLGDEFGLRVILTGATEAYKVKDEIKKRHIPVVLERVFRRATYPGEGVYNPENPALLRKEDIRIAFKPEEGGLWTFPAVAWGGGDLLEIASLAVKNGMSEEDALRAVTIEAAKIIEMDNRVGSLEPGKDANFLILSGHPLRVRSLPQAVFIEGKLVYQQQEGEHTK